MGIAELDLDTRPKSNTGEARLVERTGDILQQASGVTDDVSKLEKGPLPESLPSLSVATDQTEKKADTALNALMKEDLDSSKYLQVSCNKHLKTHLLKDKITQESELYLIKGLIKAEEAEGSNGVQTSLDAINSELWLDGAKNRLRQVPVESDSRERRFEVYNASTKEVVHSLNWSVLPGMKPEAQRPPEKNLVEARLLEPRPPESKLLQIRRTDTRVPEKPGRLQQGRPELQEKSVTQPNLEKQAKNLLLVTKMMSASELRASLHSVTPKARR